MEKIQIDPSDPDEVIRIVIMYRRHAVPLKPGEKHPTLEEVRRDVREGQRTLALNAVRTFAPYVTVFGIEDEHSVVLDVRGPKRSEILDRIETELDCVGGYLGRASKGGLFREHVEPAPRFKTLEEALAAYDASR